MSITILSDLIINKVYSATTIFTEQGTKAHRSNRPYFAVLLKYEGETVYTCNGKEYVSNEKHPVILPKGSSYDWVCTKSGHYTIIEFDCNLEYDGIFSFTLKDSDKFLRLLKETEFICTAKAPLYKMQSLKNIYTLILSLMRDVQDKYIPGEKQKKIIPALNFIASNTGSRISNEHLAKLCGMSVVYFRKIFTEVMGVSPITYARNLRIKKAREMLRSDYGSITDIALSLGYNNIYDFSRDFKKHTGVPPTKY